MKIFAKDLVRIKKAIEKFEVAKANLQGIQIQLMTASGQEAITSSIKGACEAYRALNGLMDPKAMQRIMAEYQKESMRQEIMSEVMDGAMDDAMGNLNDPDAEDELVESGARLDATVLKVGHHGSAGSTGYVFLREVIPDDAVISVGTDNSYGHPTEAALSRLRDADAQVFRTDLQGVIHAVSDGRSVTFETERSATEAQLNPTIRDAAEVYIGNVNSQIFHVSTCHSCPSEKNAVRFDSVWDAMAQGYRAHSCVE